MVSKEEEIKIPSIEKYEIINTLRIKQNVFSVKLLCETANVLRSSFYKWLKTSKLDKDQKDYEEIIERNLKGQRLTKLKKQAIKNSIALGCSPRFKKEN